MLSQISTLSREEQKQVAIEAMKQLGSIDQKDVVKQAGLPGPDQSVADKLWLIVVVSFAAVLVGAFISLALAIFINVQSDNLLLTVFTTSAAFLAGLLAPTPSSLTARNQ